MKNNILKKIIIYLFTFFWMAIIFYFSSQTAAVSTDTSNSFTALLLRAIGITPTVELIEGLRSIIRTLAHFGIFGILGVHYYLSCAVSNRVKHLFIVSLLLSLAYAIIDELHQLFSDGRAFQFFDVVIDFAGAAVFISLFMALIFACKKRKEKKNK